MKESSNHFNLVFRNTIPTITVVKWLGAYRTPNTEAAALSAVIGTRAYAGTIQVQIVAIVIIIAHSRRPIEATCPSIVRRRGEVAGVEEVVGISS